MTVRPLLICSILVTAMLLLCLTAKAEPWVKSYSLGGSTEEPLAMDATSDGGFVFAAVTDNGSTRDLWVVKLAADGTVDWESTYDSQVAGLPNIHGADTLRQLSDGGYVLGIEISNNLADSMILKLNSAGAVQWAKYYGDVNNQEGAVLEPTSDGGYVLAGVTPTGVPDWALRVVKVDSTGTVQWEELFYNPGTSCVDEAFSIREISGGGYIVAGDSCGNNAWVFKLDASGNMVWEKEFTNAKRCRSAAEISGGGFILCGHDGADVWIAELDSSGNVNWEKSLGGGYIDEGYYIFELSGGGYIFSGKYGTGSGNTVFETWIVKLDSSGNVVWQKRYGAEEGYGSAEATNGEIGVVCALSGDVCVLRLDADGGVGVCETLQDTSVMPVSLSDSSAATSATNVTFNTGSNTLTVNALSSSSTATEICRPCDTDITAAIDSVSPGTTACEGVQQTFTGSGTGEGTLTYEWDFDYGGTFSADMTGSSVDYTYPVPGTYTAMLKVTDSCPYPANQSATDTSLITILPARPTITGPADSCPGDAVTLDAGGGFSSYSWSPGGQTTQIINVNPVSTTNYTVDTLHPNGCSGSDDHTVTIHEPLPSITGPTTICNGDNAVLDAGADYSSYSWSPGGQTTRAIDVSPSSSTVYSVTVTDGYGCEGTDDHTLNVDDVPRNAPSVSCPSDVCVGEEYSVTWTSVDNTTLYHVDELCNDSVTTSTSGLSYTTTKWTAGSYCYKIRATNDCGNGVWSTTCTMTVHGNPSPTITGDTETCQGDPVDLDAGAGYASYLWSPGGQTTRTINEYITGDTTFSVTVTDSNGCEGTDDHFVTYYPAPTPTIIGETEICDGETITLDAGSGYVSYSWTPGGETTRTIDVSPSVTTMYEVTVTDGNNCSASDTHWLTVYSNPAPPTITESCFGNDIILDAGFGYASYLWDTGATTQTINIGSDTVSTYDVTVTDTNGCSSRSGYQATGPCAASKDIYEEDDSCFGPATVIHDGETQSHDFQDDFGDWIEFSACIDEVFTLQTSNLGTSCDTYLEIYETDCSTLLAWDDNGGGGLSSRIDWTAPADGVYHIKVSQADSMSGADREYDITLTGTTHPCMSWSKTFGGASDEYAMSAAQTSDGGYVVAGSTTSYGSGSTDGWITRLDEAGFLIWSNAYGEYEWDQFDHIIQTSDGDFLASGRTASWGGGSYDIWIVKLDSTGAVVWENTYGDADYDAAYEVNEAVGGGYIAAAGSRILRLNADGTLAWQKSMSGGDFRSVTEASDGGFLAASNSNGYLVKMSASGTVDWQKRLNTDYQVSFSSIDSTNDGGFIVAGGGRPSGPNDYDYWAAKLDRAGTVEWQKSYGTAGEETVNRVRRTADGGFILAGHSYGGNPFSGDIWVLKLTSAGSVEWQKLYSGSTSYEGTMSVGQAADGGFIVTGNSSSYGSGGHDFWVMKTYAHGSIDASCPFVSDTSVAGTDTAAAIDYPSLTASDTALAPVSTTAAVISTTAGIDTQCSGSCEDARAFIDNIGPSENVCPGTEQTFTGSAAGEPPITYEWDFDYGGSFAVDSTGDEVTYTYSSAGTYTAALRITDSCGTPAQDITTVAVTIYEGPSASPSNSGPVCDGNTVSFAANVSGGTSPYTYSWDFGDGAGTSTLGGPVYTYTGPGTYTAALSVVDANGCSAGVQSTFVTIYEKPSIGPVNDGPKCEGSAVAFTANPAGGISPYVYSWDFGDGTGTSTLRNPSYTYSAIGTYTATLTVSDSNACSSDIASTNVIIRENPTASPTDDAPVCPGSPVNFTAGPSGGTSPYTYIWDFDDGAGTSTLRDPVYTYTASGNYNASVTVTDSNGCAGSPQTTIVSIYDEPAVSPNSDSPGCSGSPVSFTANPSGGVSPYSYDWDFGDGSGTSTLENPAYTYNSAGTYSVSLNLTDGNGCTGTGNTVVSIGSPPSDVPGDFTVSAECGSIDLSWTDVVGETQYRIERDSGSGFAFLDNAAQDAVSFSDTSVSDGTSYTYRVRAENGCGNSSYTPELSAKTATALYSAPVITNDGEYCNALVIAWTDNYAAETVYIIERDVNVAGSWEEIDIIPADYDYYGDHGVSEGNSYEYRIKVRNACGDSSYSNTVTMTPDCTVSGTTCPTPSVLSSLENISNAPNWVESAGIAWNGTEFGVVWSDDRDGGVWKTIFAKMDASGNLISGSEKVIGDGETGNPDIAWNGTQYGVAATGNISCGEGGEHVYFFTLDTDGNLTSSQVAVSCGWFYGNNTNPRIHWNGSTWGVVWESWAWGEQEVLFQRLDTSANTQHVDPLWISSSGSTYWSGYPDVTSLGGEWYVVWEQEDGADAEIHYSRRNADGGEIAGSMLTNDSAYDWSVRAAANDSMIGLVWDRDTDPYFRALNPDGTWGSSLVQLASTPDTRDTDIASTGTEWAAVWYQADVYDDPADTYLQRIDSTGTAVGSVLNVTNEEWDDWVPRVAWAGDRWGIAYTANPSWGNSNAHGAVVSCGASTAPPSAPRDLVAETYCSALVLHWIDTAANEDEFIVERSVNGGAFQIIDYLGANSYYYLDTNVSAPDSYTYRVTASNTDGDAVSDTDKAVPLDCSLTDVLMESLTKNVDGTLDFEWSGVTWQIEVDVYRGALQTGSFSYNHDGRVECSYDAETGYLVTVTDEVNGRPDSYYIIAPNTTDSEMYGADSDGTDRPVSGAQCP